MRSPSRNSGVDIMQRSSTWEYLTLLREKFLLKSVVSLSKLENLKRVVACLLMYLYVNYMWHYILGENRL